jgi:hypothetical protein
MYIIFRDDEICNVIYGNELDTINWITEYITNQIKIFTNEKLSDDIKNVSYSVTDDKNVYTLSKTVKSTSRGYVYNSTKKKTIKIFEIKYLSFDYIISDESNVFSDDINSEINKRVLKNLDRDALFQIFCILQKIIKDSRIISFTHYNKVLTDLLRTFKKEQYTSIVKKLNRFGNTYKLKKD